MTATTAAPVIGQLLGYARVSTGHQSLDAQADALTAGGVDGDRIYTDKLTGTSTKEQRPGLAALLSYARPGDAIVVVGIDRLGRSAAEVMLTIKDLLDRDVVMGPPPIPPQIAPSSSVGARPKESESQEVTEKYRRLKRKYFELEEDVKRERSVLVEEYACDNDLKGCSVDKVNTTQKICHLREEP